MITGGKKRAGRLSSSFHPSQRTDIASNSLITSLLLYNNTRGREQESDAINLPTLLQINSSSIHEPFPTSFPSFAQIECQQLTDTSLSRLRTGIYNYRRYRYWNLPSSPSLPPVVERFTDEFRVLQFLSLRLSPGLHLRPILLRFPRRTRARNSFSRGDRVLAFIAACIAVNLSPYSEAPALENEESSRHKSSRGHNALSSLFVVVVEVDQTRCFSYPTPDELYRDKGHFQRPNFSFLARYLIDGNCDHFVLC